MKNQPESPILRKGCRMKENHSSWTNWYVYRPDYPLEAIKEEFQQGYSQTGGIYAMKPTVRVSSTKILVKQLIGWDVQNNPEKLEVLKPKHGKGSDKVFKVIKKIAIYAGKPQEKIKKVGYKKIEFTFDNDKKDLLISEREVKRIFFQKGG